MTVVEADGSPPCGPTDWRSRKSGSNSRRSRAEVGNSWLRRFLETEPQEGVLVGERLIACQ